jgi:hypothetical protein
VLNKKINSKNSDGIISKSREDNRKEDKGAIFVAQWIYIHISIVQVMIEI